MDKFKGEFQHIPLQNIVLNPDAQKARGVKHESREFQDLVQSIRTRGVQQPICVRALYSVEDGEKVPTGMYGLVTGLHRFTACQVLGFKTIPAYVRDVHEDELLEEQLVENVQRIKMRPAEEANALFRHALSHPEQSLDEIAQRMGKSRGWLDQKLALTKLPTHKKDDDTGNVTPPWGGIDVQQLVNEGRIVPANAYNLAKFCVFDPPIPESLWKLAVEKAEHTAVQEFTSWTQLQLNQIKTARRQGRPVVAYNPNIRVPLLRSKAEILTHLDRIRNNAGENPSEFTRGVIASLEFVLQIDDESWKRRCEAEEKREKEREARKQERLAGKVLESLTLGGIVSKEAAQKVLAEAEANEQ